MLLPAIFCLHVGCGEIVRTFLQFQTELLYCFLETYACDFSLLKGLQLTEQFMVYVGVVL